MTNLHYSTISGIMRSTISSLMKAADTGLQRFPSLHKSYHNYFDTQIVRWIQIVMVTMQSEGHWYTSKQAPAEHLRGKSPV